MTTKHTPTLALGAEHEGPSVRSIQIIDPVSLALVAHVYGATTPLNDQYEGLSRMHANARVLGAAPKLLAALVALEEAARQVMSGEMAASSIMIERMAAQDAIQEATVGKCCVPSAEEEALLAAGDCTPEELWGGRRPTCPKCIDRG